LIVAIVQFAIIYKPLWNEFENKSARYQIVQWNKSKSDNQEAYGVTLSIFLHCTLFVKWRFLLL